MTETKNLLQSYCDVLKCYEIVIEKLSEFEGKSWNRLGETKRIYINDVMKEATKNVRFSISWPLSMPDIHPNTFPIISLQSCRGTLIMLEKGIQAIRNYIEIETEMNEIKQELKILVESKHKLLSYCGEGLPVELN